MGRINHSERASCLAQKSVILGHPTLLADRTSAPRLEESECGSHLQKRLETPSC